MLDAQTQQGVTKQIYLLPADNSPVQLQTHLATLRVTYLADGSVSTLVEAVYQVKNDGEETVALPLILYPGIGAAEPYDVSLIAGNQTLGLSAAAGGGLAAQLDVAPDSRMTLRLNYRITVSGSPIVTLRYAPGVLRKWLGPTSTRIEVSLPNAIARESWTDTSPDGWSYASSTVDTTAIKWLYDSVAPDEEFIVQFIAPHVWAEVQAAEATSASGGPAAAYLARGNLYRSMSESEAVDSIVRDRFAAQAIAAYVDGLAQGTAPSTAELAQMHMGLATIYREQAADPERETVTHAALMVDEASAALSLLAAEDARRGELQQWLADGLRTLFLDARERNDWQRVSQVVDQMQSLPPGSVDSGLIEEGRQIVLVQQALQLLQRGEHEAAAALAGSEITAGSASTPLEQQPIFAAWRITATAKPDSLSLDIHALPAPGRETDAKTGLDNLARAWNEAIAGAAASGGSVLASDVEQAGPDSGLHLRLEAPAPFLNETLAGHVPAGADYALLRAAMAQLDPQRVERHRFFQRELSHSQPMDLRSAGEQWAAAAAALDRQAGNVRAQAADGDAKAQLLAEMQAANFRNTAEAWRDLSDDSWLLFQFQPAEDAAGQTRAWYATAMSAPVVFTVQTQSVAGDMVAGTAISALAIVAALAGLLWWLM